MQPLKEDNDARSSNATMIRTSLSASLPDQLGSSVGSSKPHTTFTNGNITFLSWLRHPQRGLPYLICSILVILIILPFCIHYYLSSFAGGGGVGSALEGLGVVAQRMGQSKLMVDRGALAGNSDEFGGLKLNDARYQIEELRNIRASVNNELMDLEKKRRNLQSELNSYRAAIDGLKANHAVAARELERIRVTLRNLELRRKEVSQENLPYIEAPRPIYPSADSLYPHSSDWFDSSLSTSTGENCRLHNCFDYSRCSLASGFHVYLYDPDKYRINTANRDQGRADDVRAKIASEFKKSPYITDSPKKACIYVVLVGPIYHTIDSSMAANIRAQLQSLPNWHADGANHLIVGITLSTNDSLDLMSALGDMGRAMFAQSVFSAAQGSKSLRNNFDVVIPPWNYGLATNEADLWQRLSMIVPARRQYLMSFTGEFYRNFTEKSVKNIPEEERDRNWKGFEEDEIWKQRGLLSAHLEENHHTSIEAGIVETLKTIQSRAVADQFRFEFSCGGNFDNKMSRYSGEWQLCGTESTRMETLHGSTFSLILASQTSSEFSISPSVLVQLLESLQSGALPIILGADRILLPFTDFIDWNSAIISLPIVRLPEIYYYIKTFTDADIIELRRRGRIIYETYLGTTSRLVESLIGLVRTRLNIPPTAMLDEKSTSVFNATFQPIREPVVDALSEQDEMLGPIEPPLDSPRFLRNFTSVGWGTVGGKEFLPGMDPFKIYPYMPFEPVLPADAKFIGSGYGFRPIGEGVGGAGKEFGEALGGNNIREQFTVVILTYEREAVLVSAVARLKGLPQLHSVVVVWNSLRPPNTDLRWPDIGVDVHVVRTKANSLNNRFLPYDVIKTEAVLSLDDDAHLRHDEILFAFRVWRESRDRIVGFPGRYNSWDMKGSNWLYNSNYSCELSLVLTGAAFFHKYYMYLYSYVMPQSIRDKVDEYLNCEDLAMNFLVSHITRKPPLKVTSRWTFRCPGCPSALSVEESHFNERHKCMNFFVRVYGYMPLLNTQYRADSVLFKTRIPHDKQKCFKFI